jgi:hypothetical protein
MKMEAYQKRVVDEKKELDGKLERLRKFSHGDIFSKLPEVEQERLGRQMNLMADYSGVLGERILAFSEVK